MQEAALPRSSRQIARTRSLLGAALSGQGRLGPAEEILLSVYDQLRDDPDAPPEYVQATIERLVSLCTAWGQPAEAARWQAELEAVSGEQPEGAPSTAPAEGGDEP